MLYNGEEVGEGGGPTVDVAVDPLEGTRLTALGQPNAIAVIAVVGARVDVLPRRRGLHGEDRRRRGRDRRDRHQRHARPRTCGRSRRRRAGASPTSASSCSNATATTSLIGELREAGARVNLIRDGDVAPAIAAARPETGVDMLYGVGGTPEGVISAAALKCVGGGIQGRLWPRDDGERQALVDAGLDPDARAVHRRPRQGRRRLRRRDRRHDRRAAARHSLRHATERSRIRSSCARAPAPSAGSRRGTN